MADDKGSSDLDVFEGLAKKGPRSAAGSFTGSHGSSAIRKAALAGRIPALGLVRHGRPGARTPCAARGPPAAEPLRPRPDLPDAWIRGLGLPTRARAEPMWRALDAALWAA